MSNSKYEPYVESPDLQGIIIVDVDGTIADLNGRSPFDWDKVEHDLPRRDVIRFIKMARDGAEVIFITGRDGSCREMTSLWIHKYFRGNPVLLMREEGDKRPDNEVKYELFNKFIRGRFNVFAVFDDRDSAVKMWREIGLLCLQVNYGEF